MSCRMIVSANWRLVAAVILLGLCSLLAIAIPSPQDEDEDSNRRIWNKRFQEARARAARRAGKLANATTSSGASPRGSRCRRRCASGCPSQKLHLASYYDT